MTPSPIVPRAAWIALVVVTIGGMAFSNIGWGLAECFIVGWITGRVSYVVKMLHQSDAELSTKSTDKPVDHRD